ncbi:PPE family domain protein [Mycobacterium kansasii 732]|nr:PPE family domain protein [Mycobacterium kansasii 732]
MTEANDDAAACNSSARRPQAAAASNIGWAPAPAYIRSELISGGNTEKFIGSIRSYVTGFVPAA